MKNKCIYCFESLNQGATILDLFLTVDVLCPTCRRQLIRVRKRFKINDIVVQSMYLYDEFYSSLLVQYKDCMDEALYSVFLYPFKLYLKIKYYGYTLIPMPSSYEKIAERGFKHVNLIFECLDLEMLDCLEKDSNQKQVLSTKKQRKEMISKIKIKQNTTIPKRILLVDDVCTTGSTLKGALEALEGRYKKCKILVVATHKLNIK